MKHGRMLVIGAVAAGVLGLLYAAAHERPIGPTAATFDQPADSPSGRYRLVVVKGYDGNVHFATFQIVSNEQHPRVLYCEKWHFRTFNRTYFFWGPDDKVWVYSGDIGAFYWTRRRDDDWHREAFTQGEPGGPALLRKIVPS